MPSMAGVVEAWTAGDARAWEGDLVRGGDRDAWWHKWRWWWGVALNEAKPDHQHHHFPATTQISFGAFDFITDSFGKVCQVSPGVIGPVTAYRYPPGIKLSPSAVSTSSPPTPASSSWLRGNSHHRQLHRQHLSVSATSLLPLPRHFKSATSTPAARSRPNPHGARDTTATPRRRPRLLRELKSCWVGFLDESVRPSDSDLGSSNNTRTSSHHPREVFVVFQETDEEKREREEEKRRIQQNPETLQHQ
uniref:Uncharacterized protein n=1 Tax=Oryza glumipatula TaxID=40148 RepID=A0A0E0A885_9ORYZ